MIVGAFALFRFLGTLMVAKRDINAQKELKRENEKIEKERKNKLKNFGKVSIHADIEKKKSTKEMHDYEDVSFEEVKND